MEPFVAVECCTNIASGSVTNLNAFHRVGQASLQIKHSSESGTIIYPNWIKHYYYWIAVFVQALFAANLISCACSASWDVICKENSILSNWIIDTFYFAVNLRYIFTQLPVTCLFSKCKLYFLLWAIHVKQIWLILIIQIYVIIN